MKFSHRAQFYRLEAILQGIRAGMQDGTYANCRAFMAASGCSRQTALRDLDFLRDEWGAPIAYDASSKGYYLTDPSWTVPAMNFARSEVFALGIARKVMTAFRGTPLEADMQSALAKIGDSLEGHIAMDPAALSAHVSVVTEDYAPQDPAIWLAVARHACRRERIRMTYRKFDGAIKEYAVDPCHLAAYHGEWYLLARRRGSESMATFAISRIRRLKGTGILFPEPKATEIQTRLQQGFGITGGEAVMDVRLRFSPKVAAYIAGRVWHASQRVRNLKNGSVELRLRTSGWKELVRFVLSWQPDVEVLHPAPLRERVIEKMRAALS